MTTIEPLQWLSMLASFVLVLVLLGATLWVLRRIGGRGMRIQGGRIAIVRVDGKDLVIAVSQQQVTLLTTLEGCQQVDSPPNSIGREVSATGARENPPDPAVTERFRQALRSMTSRLHGGAEK
jgi:flagellar biogenesis protein FliO